MQIQSDQIARITNHANNQRETLERVPAPLVGIISEYLPLIDYEKLCCAIACVRELPTSPTVWCQLYARDCPSSWTEIQRLIVDRCAPDLPGQGAFRNTGSLCQSIWNAVRPTRATPQVTQAAVRAQLAHVAMDSHRTDLWVRGPVCDLPGDDWGTTFTELKNGCFVAVKDEHIVILDPNVNQVTRLNGLPRVNVFSDPIQLQDDRIAFVTDERKICLVCLNDNNPNKVIDIQTITVQAFGGDLKQLRDGSLAYTGMLALCGTTIDGRTTIRCESDREREAIDIFYTQECQGHLNFGTALDTIHTLSSHLVTVRERIKDVVDIESGNPYPWIILKNGNIAVLNRKSNTLNIYANNGSLQNSYPCVPVLESAPLIELQDGRLAYKASKTICIQNLDGLLEKQDVSSQYSRNRTLIELDDGSLVTWTSDQYGSLVTWTIEQLSVPLEDRTFHCMHGIGRPIKKLRNGDLLCIGIHAVHIIKPNMSLPEHPLVRRAIEVAETAIQQAAIHRRIRQMIAQTVAHVAVAALAVGVGMYLDPGNR